MQRTMMQRLPVVTLAPLALAFVSTLVVAEGVKAQESNSRAEINRAVLAAPESQRAEASVVHLADDGTVVTIREGSNGLMCWDQTHLPDSQSAIDSKCTSVANRDRLAQNHAFNAAGGTEEEIEARFAEAEENGTRALSEFGTIYYWVRGTSPQDLRPHTTIAVPNATAEELGVSARPEAATLWMMQGGTTSAHLMVPGL